LTPIHKLLTLWPLRFVGRISYSMYLWHWPLIVLAYAALPAEYFSSSQKLMALVATTGVGWLSWRFIEEPFRRGQIGKGWIYRGFFAVSGALAASGLAVILLDGAPQRFSTEAIRAASLIGEGSAKAFDQGRCFLGPKDHKLADFPHSECLHAVAGRQNVLLFGDSHAQHFLAGLSQRWPDINWLVATGAGCQPTLTRPPSKTPACTALMDYMFNDFLIKTPPDTVVMAGEWVDQNVPAVVETLKWFRANRIPVVFVGPTPEWETAVPLLVAMSLARNDPGLPARHRKPSVDAFESLPTLVKPGPDLAFVFPSRSLCEAGLCRTTADDGSPLLVDTGHLSSAGSHLATMAFEGIGPFKPKG
jgi:hypothetical protein